jgi:aerobic carbon-monoxide dehydrogenase large subunit
VHTYADEMATVALSSAAQAAGQVRRRPAGELRHRHPCARPSREGGRIGVKNGTAPSLAFEIDDLTGIGPYSVYPRTSGIEANQIVNLVGGPTPASNYRAHARVVFQNKNVMCQYRAVGHPIATAVTEGLVDLAAVKLGMDPLELRRRNLIPDDAYPRTFPSGIKFEQLSHHKTLDKLSMMNYAGLRAEQDELSKQKASTAASDLRASIEVTNPSAAFYGVGGARISAQDGATVRLDATGASSATPASPSRARAPKP